MTQPSLSYAISKLESELGVSLFIRQNRRVFLTRQGKYFLEYVEEALNILDEGERNLRAMTDLADGMVVLGYFYSLSEALIPAMIEHFFEAEPVCRNVNFQFTQGLNSEIVEKLKMGDIDLGFLSSPDKDLASVPILKQRLYLCVYVSHRLAQREEVRFEDFADEPLITLSRHSDLSRRIDDLFAKHGRLPRIVMEIPESNLALYVRLRFGLAITPMVPDADLPDLRMIPIREPDFTRPIYLSWQGRQKLTAPVEKVRDFILNHYQNEEI